MAYSLSSKQERYYGLEIGPSTVLLGSRFNIGQLEYAGEPMPGANEDQLPRPGKAIELNDLNS